MQAAERTRARTRRTGDRRHAAWTAGATGPLMAVCQPDAAARRSSRPIARPRPLICAPSATGSAQPALCDVRTCSVWIAATRRRWALRALPDGTFPGWLRARTATGVAFRSRRCTSRRSAKEKERPVPHPHPAPAARGALGAAPSGEQPGHRAGGGLWRGAGPPARDGDHRSAHLPHRHLRHRPGRDSHQSERPSARSARHSATRAARRSTAASSIRTSSGRRRYRSPATRPGWPTPTATTNLADTLPFLHHRAGNGPWRADCLLPPRPRGGHARYVRSGTR